MTRTKMTVDQAYFWETAPMPGDIAFQIAFTHNKSIAYFWFHVIRFWERYWILLRGSFKACVDYFPFVSPNNSPWILM